MSLLSTFLSGVRVLDLSRHLPGPLCTLYLVDMGAEVVKLESPQGDEVREVGPRDAEGRAVFFETLSAGKRLLRLDLRDADSRGKFLDMLRGFDVVVESFRPGVMERLGVGYDTLRQINPRIVLCSMSGFGRGGPDQNRAGHDANYLALGGVLDRNRSGEKPHFFDPPVADCTGSLTAAVAVLGALRRAERTGQGCHLDVALADAAMSLQMLQIAEMHATGITPQANGGLLTGGTACYNVYTTAEGRFVTLCAVEPKFWKAFCQAAGHIDWIERGNDAVPQRALIEAVATFFRGLTLAQAQEKFESADCCFAPVLTLKEALETPHVRARQLVQHAAGLPQALFPVHVNGEPPQPREPARDLSHS